MGDHISGEFLLLLASSLIGCFLGNAFLVKVKTTHSRFLKKFFHVPARKSSTGAVLLGGLPLAVAIISSYFSLLYFEAFRDFLLFSERYLMKYWLIGSVFFLLYGYLDDKYELRAIAKLSFQFIGIFIFAFLSSKVIWPNYSTIAFVIISLWGLCVVNGANLLDGLDTLAIKLFSAIYLTFFTLGVVYGSTPVILGSMISASPLIAFLYFNKEPAKIHFGEIGGSFLGFSFLLLSCFLFNSLRFKFFHFRAMSIALIPLTLPLVELSISFIRRVYNKKSPFKGDKLHLHYILKDKYFLSPTLISNMMSLFYLLTCLSTITISHIIHPLFALVLDILLIVGVYLSIGQKFWNSNDRIKLNPKNIFKYMQKKNVQIIDSSSIDHFHLTVKIPDKKISTQRDDDNDDGSDEDIAA